MSIFATAKAGFVGLSLIKKIGASLAPILIILAGWFVVNRWVDGIYDDGVNSRNEEVATLKRDFKGTKDKLEVAEAKIIKINAKLSSCNSKVEGMVAEHIDQLKAQAKTFNSTQKASSDALKALAKNETGRQNFYAGLTAQLNGLKYEPDTKNGGCVVVGGGRILLNAAKGKN